MSGQLNRYRRAVRAVAPAGAVAALVLALHAPGGAQQPCNPVIDGTYCAEQMPRSRAGAPQPIIRPIGSIGSAISTNTTPAGTLGGISIRSGGQTCVGLLRRGACS
jgi:hypothetical protein